jgi:hypothetical protein
VSISFFKALTLNSWIVVPDIMKERGALIFNVSGSVKIGPWTAEDEGDKFLPNIGNHLRRHAAWHSETPELSIKWMWKSQNSEVRKYRYSAVIPALRTVLFNCAWNLTSAWDILLDMKCVLHFEIQFFFYMFISEINTECLFHRIAQNDSCHGRPTGYHKTALPRDRLK